MLKKLLMIAAGLFIVSILVLSLIDALSSQTNPLVDDMAVIQDASVPVDKSVDKAISVDISEKKNKRNKNVSK